MGTTAKLHLPYPEGGDQADGPSAIQSLGQAVEDYFYSRTQPTGITRTPTYFWGTVTAFPTTGVLIGDSCYRSDLGALMVYNGAGWVNGGRATYVQTADPGNVPDGSIWFQI